MGGYWSQTVKVNESQMCCTQYKSKIRIGYTANPLKRGIWRVKTERNCLDQ